MAHKSKTLELADALEKNGDGCTCCAYASFECCCNAVWGSDYTREAAAEIRRLHEENERLREAVAAEREKVVAWMHSNSYATGHGDTIEDLLKELEWQVAEREREACVELCLEHSKLNVDDANVEFSHLASYEFGKQVGAATCATAIRARGEV